MKRMLSALVFSVILMLALPVLIVTFFRGSLPEAEVSGESVDKIKVYNSKTGQYFETDFGEYLKCVLASEMPASFEPEALRAQTVAARSYYLYKLENGSAPEAHPEALICTDHNHCQAYLSKDSLKEKNGDAWMNEFWGKISDAVESTADVVMRYDGKIVNAVFFSTSSGRTESSADVWGEDVPYLISVESEGEEASSKFTSSVTLPLEEFKAEIKEKHPEASWGEGAGLIDDLKRSDAGTIKSVTAGGAVMSGAEIRTLFSLNSANAEFLIDGDMLIINVKGYGHQVGMSQYGANYQAKLGKTYEEILKKYYTGVTVEKRGS